MGRPIKGEKNEIIIRQSNYVTTARYNYTAQEKRILYRIVEQAHKFIEANREWFDSNKGKYQVKEHKKLEMPITAFMNKDQIEKGGGKSYSEVVDAFRSLVFKRIDFKGNQEFAFGGILNFADQLKGEGKISFMVHKFVWQSALDFSKGYSEIDLLIVMDLKSPYSMRFYEMAKSWQDRMNHSLSVEHFREEFGCLDKYPNIGDLKRYVIDVAKKELDKVSPISFTYEQEKRGRSVTTFHFHFYENKKCVHKDIEKRKLLSKYPTAAIPSEIRQWFSNKLGMTSAQINSNIILFDKLYQLFRDSMVNELEETFQYIYSQGFRPQENIGWFIQNLKKKVENATK